MNNSQIQIKMNQTDINYIVNILTNAIKHHDWDMANEVLEYLIDFQDEPTQFEEE